MQTRCARVFRWPGSVFGTRCPAFGVDLVPGPRYQVPGTWYLTPVPHSHIPNPDRQWTRFI